MTWNEGKLIFLVFCFLTGHCNLVRARTLQDVANKLIDDMNWNWGDSILYWNSVCIDTCSCDFDTELVPNPDQDGPTRTSRALAIIHGVMYDAFNYVKQPCKLIHYVSSIRPISPESQDATAMAAIAQGAYRCLVALFPRQQTVYDQVRDAYMKILQSVMVSGQEVDDGVTIGDLIAKTVLDERADDGSNLTVNHYIPSAPGYHRADPTHPKQKLHCPHWGDVKPFILESGSQFRSPNVVGLTQEERLKYLDSKRFIRDYMQISTLGEKDSKCRTDEQTEIGIFWAYDGAPKLGVPPRFYNKIARLIAIQQANTMAQNAQLLAVINYALADGCICSWDTKYVYDFWRPIVAIRTGTRLLKPIPTWTPLGAPADGNGDNFTPGFPSFNSGHAVFCSALFQVLRRFYKTDNLSFTLDSEEYNGETIDSITKQARPKKTRSYESFSQAEMENELGRTYLGIHWLFDQRNGRTMGKSVADYICDELL